MPTKPPLAAGRSRTDQLTQIVWGFIHFRDSDDRTLPTSGSSPCACFFACHAFLPSFWRWVKVLGDCLAGCGSVRPGGCVRCGEGTRVSAGGAAGDGPSPGKLLAEEDGGSMREGIDSSKSDSGTRAGEFSAEEGGVVAGLGSGDGRGDSG